MTDFTDKLRLKEMAEEDIYFAKRDRELIEALHEKKLVEHLKDDTGEKEKQAIELQEKYHEATRKYGSDTLRLAKRYQKLVKKALQLIRG